MRIPKIVFTPRLSRIGVKINIADLTRLPLFVVNLKINYLLNVYFEIYYLEMSQKYVRGVAQRAYLFVVNWRLKLWQLA